MKILKVFNNNSVAAISDELGDIILTGVWGSVFKELVMKLTKAGLKRHIFEDDQQKRFEQSIEINSLHIF